jgi:hypothetical protein
MTREGKMSKITKCSVCGNPSVEERIAELMKRLESKTEWGEMQQRKALGLEKEKKELEIDLSAAGVVKHYEDKLSSLIGQVEKSTIDLLKDIWKEGNYRHEEGADQMAVVWDFIMIVENRYKEVLKLLNDSKGGEVPTASRSGEMRDIAVRDEAGVSGTPKPKETTGTSSLPSSEEEVVE